ncbi:PIR Superfamily Protein [Plasmodium ovale curtisi]|uniref:PIR Superfamily Protein n=1 Tax=Plasmodium ovale curtisi TaxID=864141 RepID=A0A1A8X1C6_PLAOA|nr:PIR Superfamily Protein [Plasmodium ovale curtisi]
MEATIPRVTRFSHVPSHKFNEKLNAPVEENKYSEYSFKINDLIYEYPWVEEIFKKLGRNITVTKDENKDDHFNKKRCFDLNFWLYSQVYNKSESIGDNKKIEEIIVKLQGIWKSICDEKFTGQNDVCCPDYNLYNNITYLNEMKDLFDFIEDFEIIKKEVIKDTYNSCLKYLEYLRERVPLYYPWITSCNMEEGATCKRYIKDYDNYDPENVLYSLNYFTLLVTYLLYPCYKEIVNIFVDAKELSQRSEKVYNNKNLKFEDMLFYQNYYYNTILSSIFKSISLAAIIFLPIILIILGSIMMIFVLYKFTPFGKFILLTRARIKRKIQSKLNYEDIKLINEYDDLIENKRKEKMYSILYSSLSDGLDDSDEDYLLH